MIAARRLESSALLGRVCANPVCERTARRGDRRCNRCSVWWYRHHAERPAGPSLRPRRLPPPEHCVDPDCVACAEEHAAYEAANRCVNPVCDQPRHARYRRCLACSRWLYVHGSERPEWLTRPRDVPPPRPLCRMAGCERPMVGRGLCGLHYQRWRRLRRQARAAGRGPCLNPACELFAAPRSRRCGGCQMHHWRRGTERPAAVCARSLARWIGAEPPRAPTMRCQEPDCPRRVHGRGRCNTHYRRWWLATRAVAS